MHNMAHTTTTDIATATPQEGLSRTQMVLCAAGIILLLLAPFFVYPVFLMKILCFALFACAFNLLLGYTGLLSFGHATFFGGAAYFTAHAVQEWGFSPEIGILTGLPGAALPGPVMGFSAFRQI